MALQKAVNNLKEGSKEDKVAVASGIAVSVVVVLLILWAIFFLRGIARGSQQTQLGGGAQDQFNFQSVKDAQQQLQQDFSNQNTDLQNIPYQTAQSQQAAQQQSVQQQVSGQGNNQFGGSSY